MANSGTSRLQVSLRWVSEAEPVGGRHQVPLESGPLGRPLGRRGKVVATSTWVIETARPHAHLYPPLKMGMTKILSSLTGVHGDRTNPWTMPSREPAAVLAMSATILTISPIFTCSLGPFLANLSEMSLVWAVSHSSVFRSGLF